NLGLAVEAAMAGLPFGASVGLRWRLVLCLVSVVDEIIGVRLETAFAKKPAEEQEDSHSGENKNDVPVWAIKDGDERWQAKAPSRILVVFGKGLVTVNRVFDGALEIALESPAMNGP